MSVRSLRRRNSKIKSTEGLEDSDSSFLQTKSSSTDEKNVRNIRKVRKTLDLIYFEPTDNDQENSVPTKSTQKKNHKSKFFKDQINLKFDLNNGNHKHKKNRRYNLLEDQEDEGLYFTNANKSDSLETHDNLRTDPYTDQKNRKIVRAKRLLKQKNDTVLKELIVQTKNENVEKVLTPESCNESGEYPMLKEVDTASTNIDEKNASTSNSCTEFITSLSSPISPSENNLLPLSKHLHFSSSQEGLQPSTEGVVEPIKNRRTYELEDSIIDVSLLKSVSEQDSIRINTLSNSEQDSNELKTPNNLQSKVTMRRKWERINTPSSLQINDSPSWVNKIEKLQTPAKQIMSTAKKCRSNLSLPMIDSPGKVEKKEKLQTPTKEKSTSKKFVSKVKIPNFAAIHQKALEKMESIDEYKDRKEKRAKMLMSGQKPELQAKSTTKKESRKNLRFAADTMNIEKSPTFIPLPNTPIPKKVLNKNANNSPKSPIPFKWDFSKVPKFDFCTEKVSKTPHKFDFNNWQKSVPNWNVEKKSDKKNQIVKKLKPFTFQNSSNKQIKSVANKNKPEKNTLETRRCTIKGVRSNRRFELLMNMRKGK